MRESGLVLALSLNFFVSAAMGLEPAIKQEELQDQFSLFAGQIDEDMLESLPVQNGGKVSAYLTVARGQIMSLTGASTLWELSPIQLHLGLATFTSANDLQFIEIRQNPLRQKLGLSRKRLLFAPNELLRTSLNTQAEIIRGKQTKGGSISETEKAILDLSERLSLTAELLSGQTFKQLVGPPALSAATVYLKALSAQSPEVPVLGADLVQKLAEADAEDDVANRLSLEVLHTRLAPVLWTTLLCFLSGVALLLLLRFPLAGIGRGLQILKALPPLAVGSTLVLRGLMNCALPVNGAFDVLLWLNLLILVSAFIWKETRFNQSLHAYVILFCGVLLGFTQAFPQVMDSFFRLPVNGGPSPWLSLHVVTLSLAYAALSMGMLRANHLILTSLRQFHSEVSIRAAARSQIAICKLGLFFLVLGTYFGCLLSGEVWGTFWTWEAKQVCSLVCALAYGLIILAFNVHWLSDRGTLAASLVAFLVLLASWIGSGLWLTTAHNAYTGLSGGLPLLLIFASLQVFLLLIGLTLKQTSAPTP